MAGKFTDAMKAAKAVRETDVEEQVEVSTELQQSVNTELKEVDDPLVSVTIKVAKSVRQHWQIESRRANTTVTADIIAFLTEKYGKP